MSSKKEPHSMRPALLPMLGTSLGVSWNPPSNEELIQQAKDLGVHNPPTATEVRAKQAQAAKRLEELQQRLSAPNILAGMDFARDIETDTWVITMPDGTRRHITREQLENKFPSNLAGAGQHYAKPWNNYDKLRMRLGLPEGDQFGCHVNIYMGANSVYVFVASDDKALILEDPVGLFPSDSMVGQFRLWLESIK